MSPLTLCSRGFLIQRVVKSMHSPILGRLGETLPLNFCRHPSLINLNV